MSFLKRLFGKQPAEPRSFRHLDFATKFPHVVWTSSWLQPADAKELFRYKVFSARLEPSGEFEVVLVAVYKDGTKEKLQHWSVRPELFDAGKPLIDDLQEAFGVTFESVDLSHCTSVEAFDEEARRLGWEVSWAFLPRRLTIRSSGQPGFARLPLSSCSVSRLNPPICVF